MDEYIAKKLAIELMHQSSYLSDGDLLEVNGNLAKARIEAEPAANVVPIRLGEWLDGYKMQTCSLCKCRGKKSWTFCPHCGARMIYGERKENCDETD